MKFCFIVKATVSFSVEVESDSLDDAIEKAKEADTMALCHHCASTTPGTWCTEIDCNAQEGDLVGVHPESVDFDEAVKKWSDDA